MSWVAAFEQNNKISFASPGRPKLQSVKNRLQESCDLLSEIDEWLDFFSDPQRLWNYLLGEPPQESVRSVRLHSLQLEDSPVVRCKLISCCSNTELDFRRVKYGEWISGPFDGGKCCTYMRALTERR